MSALHKSFVVRFLEWAKKRVDFGKKRLDLYGVKS